MCKWEQSDKVSRQKVKGDDEFGHIIHNYLWLGLDAEEFIDENVDKNSSE